MTEPGPLSFSLVAIAAAVLGPVLGPYALIAFAAAAGSLLALSREPAGTRWEGVRYVLAGTLIALLFTTPAVWAMETYLQVPARIALVPIAAILGAFRNQVLSLIKLVLDQIPALVGAFLPGAGRGRGDGQ